MPHRFLCSFVSFLLIWYIGASRRRDNVSLVVEGELANLEVSQNRPHSPMAI